jgi:hypothetical protein
LEWQRLSAPIPERGQGGEGDQLQQIALPGAVLADEADESASASSSIVRSATLRQRSISLRRIFIGQRSAI